MALGSFRRIGTGVLIPARRRGDDSAAWPSWTPFRRIVVRVPVLSRARQRQGWASTGRGLPEHCGNDGRARPVPAPIPPWAVQARTHPFRHPSHSPDSACVPAAAWGLGSSRRAAAAGGKNKQSRVSEQVIQMRDSTRHRARCVASVAPSNVISGSRCKQGASKCLWQISGEGDGRATGADYRW